MLANMTEKNLRKLSAPFIASRLAGKMVSLPAFRFGERANFALKMRGKEAL